MVSLALILSILSASSVQAARLADQPHVQLVGLRGHAQVRKPDEKEKKEPADSEIIEGPDCGHVKGIIGKWQKSSKVGTILGESNGAVGAANSASDMADAAAEKAKEMAASAAKVGGGAFKAAEDAAKGATEAATKASTASGDLQSQIDKVKDVVAAADGAGYAAKDEDIAGLRKKKQEATDATKAAISAGKSALKRGEKARQAAMKDAGAAAEIIKGVTKSADELAKTGADVKQKSQWVADDGNKNAGKAKDVSGKLDAKIADAGDQAPVWQALKDNLDSEVEGLETAATDLEGKITDLDSAIEESKGSAKPLQEALDAGKKEGMGDKSAEIESAETATQKLKEAIEAVKLEAKTVTKRQASVENMAAEAAAKLK